ncbi:hypothetical protein KJ815_13195, partial [bacterium]|nr:hypothetical protein [bacterium]
MRASEKAILWVLVVVPLFWVSPIWAQCSGNLLGCLDENATPQRFAVSTWTNDGHCPASGHITLMSEFPGIEFGPYVDSFFDVFTEVYRVKPEVVVMAPPPPMMPFLIHAMVDFEDPAYTDLVYAEQVMWDPGLSRLVIVRPTPCMGDEVPPSMGPMTSACFKVCHRIYYVDLGSRLVLGRPNISVTPGCTGINCAMEPCVPGAPTDYVYKVYASGTRWVLEFEYSNPAAEPRCYCVSYTGNQPQGYNVKHLAVMNAEMQTLDLTVWTTNPLHVACGTMEVFSYPPGAYISIPVQSLEASSEPYTWHIPVAAGAFDVGDTCMLAAYFSYGPEPMCPEYTDQWAVEYVIYSTQKGARTLRPEISCDPSAYVPEQLVLGVPECMIVCHDIYYIPLIFPGPGIPSVIVQEGCGPMSTPCSNPLCDPGLPGEYRYDVLRIGGTWFLEFEHSNPQHVPACYCVTLDGYTPLPQEPYLLCAMNEAHQTLDVSLWSSDCTWPWHGEFTVTTNPPGKIDPDWWVESFFDVFCLPHTWEFPVHPSLTTNPGENFQIIIECDIFGPGSDPFEGQVAYKEPVIVTPMGTLAPWNPEPPCMGDWVPPSMVPLESQCFQVCHRIYETVLLYNEGGGRPIISVTPGCQGQPMDNCVLTPCVPGGPQDFVYDVYHNGVDWILRFEYSNPYVEPVCYCVTYEGNVPYDCETFQLAALDEGHMQFEVSVRTHSNEGWECPADGFITIFSIPPGATIGPYIDSFFDVFTEWHTVSPNVDPGSFSPGETFQL